MTTMSFDAFLSYAHEDARSVAWLGGYLANAWVPGKPRRSVFRDAERLVAGPLPRELQDNLRKSRFLVVCCSDAAAGSPWVAQEIASFVALHGGDEEAWDRVLACQVGARTDRGVAPKPAAIGERERKSGAEWYLPDLRGDPAGARGAGRRHYEREAAALLARLVDLPDRQAVLARIARRRRALMVGLAFTMLVTAAAYGAWSRWLQTPDGALFNGVRAMLSAGEVRIDDIGGLVQGARGLGALGQRAKVEALARYVRSDDFAAVIRAAGLLAEDPPQCDRALRLLADVDTVFPQAHLAACAHCRSHEGACPGPRQDGIGGLERLIAAGDVPEAIALVAREKWDPEERLRTDVLLATVGVPTPASKLREHVAEWVESKEHPFDVLYDGVGLLAELDLAGSIGTTVSAHVARAAVHATRRLDPSHEFAWLVVQGLAAHLAGTPSRSAAMRLLTIEPEKPFVDHPDYAPAWAWRGLALHRLGEDRASREAFEISTACSVASVPAGSQWDELVRVQSARVLAGQWAEAFETVALAGDEQIRVRQYARLVDLWARRIGRVPWPWRISP